MAKKVDSKQISLPTDKPLPKMPEGYYSGDKPNPNLRAFAEAHFKEKPYDPENDDYGVFAFNKPIEATKSTAIYNMHSYHQGKKPHDAIRQYIRHYTKPGDLVLDPFCGSGSTALAALLDGRKAIAIDRSPAATFITKNYCMPVNVYELQTAFEVLKSTVKPEMDWLYETYCDRCGGKATTSYTVYSQVFQCSRCMEKIPLFDCVEAEGQTSLGKPKKINSCPHCYKKGFVEEISGRDEKLGAVPVMVNYLCESGCRPVRGQRRYNDLNSKKREYFEKYDLDKIRKIEAKEIQYWFPKQRMMHAREDQDCWGIKWRAGTSNFRTVDELFTKRNLWALALFMEAINDKHDDSIRFAFSSLLLGLSKMCRYDPRWSFPFPLMTGTYYMPPISKEMNVLSSLSSKIERTLTRGWRIVCEGVTSKNVGILISTQSAASLSAIPTNSIDYIFTDPPYGDNVQYGELNFVWESWLGFDNTWHDEEIIVNSVRGKSEVDWATMMRKAMAECCRVLKPGRWLSLCYHDTAEGTWALVQDVMAEVGFIVDRSDSALFIETSTKSYNQINADKVTKRDLVINFRKPKPVEVAVLLTISGNEDETSFNEKVRSIIREYLAEYPGATKDRIYDELVSRMVRAGRMEAHNFDELLKQIAESAETSAERVKEKAERWYLKESEQFVTDAAESAKEDLVATKISAYISKNLKDKPGMEGVHYSDLFEHYVYTVKDKPRRPLAEWLLDYFYMTEAGTYRLPASEEEEHLKTEGRTRGTYRRIKRYLAWLEQGVAVPEKERPHDATLAEWIRHCKRSGLYAQGKLLYEKGGLDINNLPEEVMVNVEEDYQVCARLLVRSAGVDSKNKSKRWQQIK